MHPSSALHTNLLINHVCINWINNSCFWITNVPFTCVCDMYVLLPFWCHGIYLQVTKNRPRNLSKPCTRPHSEKMFKFPCLRLFAFSVVWVILHCQSFPVSFYFSFILFTWWFLTGWMFVCVTFGRNWCIWFLRWWAVHFLSSTLKSTESLSCCSILQSLEVFWEVFFVPIPKLLFWFLFTIWESDLTRLVSMRLFFVSVFFFISVSISQLVYKLFVHGPFTPRRSKVVSCLEEERQLCDCVVLFSRIASLPASVPGCWILWLHFPWNRFPCLACHSGWWPRVCLVWYY